MFNILMPDERKLTVKIAKVVPLTCHGHSRPVTHLSFSSVLDDGIEQYYLISACKDNNPMLRDGVTGDWIGTFIGHKGAVWQSRTSDCGTLAVTASADFTAYVHHSIHKWRKELIDL